MHGNPMNKFARTIWQAAFDRGTNRGCVSVVQRTGKPFVGHGRKSPLPSFSILNRIQNKLNLVYNNYLATKMLTQRNSHAKKTEREMQIINHSTQLTGVFSLVPYFQQPTSLRCLSPRVHGHEGPRRESCSAQIVVTAKTTTGQVRSHQHSQIPCPLANSIAYNSYRVVNSVTLVPAGDVK